MQVIGFNAQPLFSKRDGVATYTLELIKAAALLRPEDSFVGICFSDPSATKDVLANELQGIVNIRFIKSSLSWQIVRMLAEVGIWVPLDKMMRIHLDGFIYSNFTCLPWVSKKVPKALIVHDAVYKHYPETVSKPNLYYLKKFVPLSSHKPNVSVFSASNHAANDLQTILNIKVIPAAPGPSSRPVPSRGSKKYLLCVGTIEPRKNLNRLIQAYRMLDEDVKKRHHLIILGGLGWYSDETIEIINQTKYVQYLGRVDDASRDTLMQNMHALVMPSLYEGFGIPVLDAALINKPILTSIDSPMSEITTKNGAILVTPSDTTSILKGLKLLLNLEPDQLAHMTQVAHDSASKYTWDRTAKAIMSSLGKTREK